MKDEVNWCFGNPDEDDCRWMNKWMKTMARNEKKTIDNMIDELMAKMDAFGKDRCIDVCSFTDPTLSI